VGSAVGIIALAGTTVGGVAATGFALPPRPKKEKCDATGPTVVAAGVAFAQLLAAGCGQLFVAHFLPSFTQGIPAVGSLQS
jgi:hypothetical protein